MCDMGMRLPSAVDLKRGVERGRGRRCHDGVIVDTPENSWMASVYSGLAPNRLYHMLLHDKKG